MKLAMKEQIAIGIAADTPGVSAADVLVTLSAGSVVVEATITPPAGSSAETIKEELLGSTTLAAIVIKHLKKVPNLSTVTQGSLTPSSMTGIQIAVLKAIKPGETTSAVPTTEPRVEGIASMVANVAHRSQVLHA